MLAQMLHPSWWFAPLGGGVWVWHAAATLIGWLAFPLAFALFPRLADRGYAVSRILGAFLLTYFNWLLCHRLMVFSGASLAVSLALIGVLSLAALARHWREMGDFLRRRWGWALCAEILAAVLFLLLANIRSYCSDINYRPSFHGAEKLGNMMMLAAMCKTEQFPVEDSWFCRRSSLEGEAGLAPNEDEPPPWINYYYGSHLQWATLARLSGQPPEIAFNLALATLFSWIGLGAYGLALNLAKRRRVAVAAALFLVFAGNLEPLEQLPRLLKRYEAYRGYGENASAGPLRPFDWEEFTSAAPFDLWRASRVILRDASSGDGRTVNEFPYFSFILGDLHAHCSALALNLLLLHVLLAIWLRKEESALTWAECALRAPHAPLLLCLLAGGLYWYNGWEPLPLAILLAAMFLCDRNDWTIRPVFAPLSAAAFGALIFGMGLFGFFYLYLREFEPPIQAADGAPSWKAALLIVKPRPWALASSVRELFVFWGIVWLPLILAILRRVWRLARDFGMNRYLGLAAAAALFGAAVLALESGGLAAPICLALAAGAGALAWSANRSEAEQFAARLAFAGFCAIFIAEVVYVQDGMGEGYQRYNTVFKLYYPAYAYLALAAVIFLWQQNRTLGLAKRRAAQWALRIGMIGLAGLGAVYPYMATWARTDGFFAIGGEDGLRGARINEAMRRRTLDGLEHLGAAEDSPDDLAAIRWLKANIEGRPHILEAAGPAYSETGRVSAYTGLPTVIGWDNHECQWRGWRYYPAVQRRQDNVDQIFQSASPFAAAPLLRRYGIEYVFAGRLERERYGEESLEKFALIGREAFRSGATRVYALGGGAIARFGGADIPIPAPRFDDTLTTQGAAAGGFAAIELPARTAAE